MANVDSPFAFGYRLLAQTLSDLAVLQPERIYASIPKSVSLSDGFLDVSFRDMERMVGALEGWIEQTWGKSSSFETIAYFGISDLRSVVVFFAAVNCGYKVFFPSPRNATAANVSLLEQTECSKVIYAKEMKSIADEILQLNIVSAVLAPSFEEMLQMLPGRRSRSKRSFDEAKDDPIIILHSSGSTGLPKPITMTNGTFSVLDSERFLPTVQGRSNRDFSIWDFEGGGKFFTVFPYFHLAGFLSLVVNPVFTEASSVVIGPPLAPPSGSLMKDVLKHQKIKALYIPPSVAEQLLAEPNGVDYFKSLDFICYSGGPFSPDAGQKLVGVTNLVPLYGSTEAFQTPQLVPSKEDWAYMEWNPHFKHEMQLAEDGAYELVLFTDASTEKISALNHNFPSISEWRTRDLFKPHPSKKSLWQYYGRRDDIIVFSNGEKFNPVPMELMIGSSKLLSGVLVVGQGRLQASLLLEPKPSIVQDDSTIVEDIWPIVDRANALAPVQGQIQKSKVHIVAPNAFIRAGKGTVIRKLSENKLAEEIDQLYQNERPQALLKSPSERVAVEIFVRDVINDAFPRTLGPDDDLLASGLDSLKSTEIIRQLKSGAKDVWDSHLLGWISLDLVYRYPSINQLSEVLFNFFSVGILPSVTESSEEVAKIVAAYTKDLPAHTIDSKRTRRATFTIALTGSNGSLGTAVLQKLMNNKIGTQVYCLNRRHAEEHEAKFTSRARFFRVQLHENHLGLGEADYTTLVSDVDIIIHNAWQVDFSLPLHAFQQQIRGTRRLIDWSLQSPRHPRIVFCSSVSSVMNWPLVHAVTPIIPEAVVSDNGSALATGYSRSKLVAEQILAAASERSGLDVIILRLGQIVQPGDFSSEFERSTRSWIPGLFQTSRTLGCFPTDICDVDWLSLDEASSILLETSTQTLPLSSTFKGQLLVYNSINPSPCSWQEVLPQLYELGVTPEKTTSLRDWVLMLQNALEKESKDADNILPSSKILPFFQALGKGKEGLRYHTHHVREVCLTLQRIESVDREKILGWANF